MNTKERKALLNVFSLYENMPNLWQKAHKEYANKDVREASFQVLLEAYQKFDEEATVGHLKKRITNMRTTYGKELNKINSSKTTGAGAHEVYRPTLWYFDALSFLESTTEPCRNTSDTLDEDLPSSDEDSQPVASTSRRTPTKKKKRETLLQQQEKFLKTTESLLSTKDGEEEWEVFGKAIGLQMKDLNNIQMIIAQKMISEVIFYAKLGRLSEDSHIEPLAPHTNRSLTNYSSQSSYFSPSPNYDQSSSHSSSSPRSHNMQSTWPKHQFSNKRPSSSTSYRSQPTGPSDSPQYHSPSHHSPSHQCHSPSPQYHPPSSPQNHVSSYHNQRTRQHSVKFEPPCHSSSPSHVQALSPPSINNRQSSLNIQSQTSYNPSSSPSPSPALLHPSSAYRSAESHSHVQVQMTQPQHSFDSSEVITVNHPEEFLAYINDDEPTENSSTTVSEGPANVMKDYLIFKVRKD